MTQSTARASSDRSRAGLLGALALAADAADDVVLGTVRDVHCAVARRVHGLTLRTPAGSDPAGEVVQGRVSSAIYAGLGNGLRATSRGLRPPTGTSADGSRTPPAAAWWSRPSTASWGTGSPRSVPTSRSRWRYAAVAVTCGSTRPPSRAAFPSATGDVVVFLHGLGEADEAWQRKARETGGSYGKRLAAETSWTPVYLRANSGLPIAENGVALASLLDDLVSAWPTAVRRIALVGHSMGGLIMRAACAVDTDAESPWNDLVTDVVTLGTPHLGAPLERGVALGAKALSWLPESAPFGRILEYRSVGILDLRGGLAPDIQNLPNAKYHLVAATLAESPRHPVSETLGDMLVRYPSATGKARRGREMFPGADVLHVKGGHFDLLNHPQVYDALRGWLS